MNNRQAKTDCTETSTHSMCCVMCKTTKQISKITSTLTKTVADICYC